MGEYEGETEEVGRLGGGGGGGETEKADRQRQTNRQTELSQGDVGLCVACKAVPGGHNDSSVLAAMDQTCKMASHCLRYASIVPLLRVTLVSLSHMYAIKLLREAMREREREGGREGERERERRRRRKRRGDRQTGKGEGEDDKGWEGETDKECGKGSR